MGKVKVCNFYYEKTNRYGKEHTFICVTEESIGYMNEKHVNDSRIYTIFSDIDNNIVILNIDENYKDFCEEWTTGMKYTYKNVCKVVKMIITFLNVRYKN